MSTASAAKPVMQRHSGERPGEELEQQTERLRAVVGQVSRRLRGTTAGAGLTPSQISVLFTVVRAGEIRVSAVAQKEGMNPTMVSRTAATLGDAGLIARDTDSLDRRTAIVRPTAAGRRLRERIHRERAQALARHVRELSRAS